MTHPSTPAHDDHDKRVPAIVPADEQQRICDAWRVWHECVDMARKYPDAPPFAPFVVVNAELERLRELARLRDITAAQQNGAPPAPLGRLTGPRYEAWRALVRRAYEGVDAPETCVAVLAAENDLRRQHLRVNKKRDAVRALTAQLETERAAVKYFYDACVRQKAEIARLTAQLQGGN